MSMIFADICKRCCHINNCLTKMFKREKEKPARRGKRTEASAWKGSITADRWATKGSGIDNNAETSGASVKLPTQTNAD